MDVLLEVQAKLEAILSSYESQVTLQPHQIFVVGCSTSEVLGSKIGTAGTVEVAQVLFRVLDAFATKHQLYLAFQCCEHLNRALVVEQTLVQRLGLEEVSVIPVKTAGGAMAETAYRSFHQPTVVEHLQAHGGIDIGDTFIGMHIKHVAIPVRANTNSIGEAHVTLATSRPKLIGGPRATYQNNEH